MSIALSHLCRFGGLAPVHDFAKYSTPEDAQKFVQARVIECKAQTSLPLLTCTPQTPAQESSDLTTCTTCLLLAHNKQQEGGKSDGLLWAVSLNLNAGTSYVSCGTPLNADVRCNMRSRRDLECFVQQVYRGCQGDICAGISTHSSGTITTCRRAAENNRLRPPRRESHPPCLSRLPHLHRMEAIPSPGTMSLPKRSKIGG